MSAKSVELADAIVETLNDTANTYVLNFEAKRRAAPLTVDEALELKDLAVTVFTGAAKAERATRGKFLRTYRPVVAIQRKLDGNTAEVNLALVDQLQELVEQIETVLEDTTLVGLGLVSFDEEQDREQYNVEAMQSLKFFATAIVLDYTG